MNPEPKDNGLDPYEAWAHDRLTPLLGPLRRIDRGGGPAGLHDFEADLPGGSVAALEVTGEVDDQRLNLEASTERHLSSITVPDSDSLWLVGLAATARVNAIKPGDLRGLLGDLKASGRRNAHNIGDYHDPFVARLGALGIESVYAVKAKAGSEGMVMVRAGTYGGWGWDGAAIDRWLDEFLDTAQGKNKLSKLGRSEVAERHLVIVLDPFSQAWEFPWGSPPATNAAPPTTRSPRLHRRSRSRTFGYCPLSRRRKTSLFGHAGVDGPSTSPMGPDGLV